MSTSEFLKESLEHWRYVRQGLIAEVDNMPADRFDFRATPDVKSVHELVQHILEGSMMMVGELSRESPDFRRLPPPALLEQYSARARAAQGKTELVDLLGSQFQEGMTSFTELGVDAMMAPVTNFDGSQWSRLQWFFHGVTEEMYHRGQLVTYARLMGLVPALTQRIRSATQ